MRRCGSTGSEGQDTTTSCAAAAAASLHKTTSQAARQAVHSSVDCVQALAGWHSPSLSPQKPGDSSKSPGISPTAASQQVKQQRFMH
jgi:hypothetical protein